MNSRASSISFRPPRASKRSRRALVGFAAACVGALLLGASTRAAGQCVPSGSGLSCYEVTLQGDVWQQLTPFGAALDLSAGVAVLDADDFPMAVLPPTAAAAATWTDRETQCAYDGLNTACAPFAAGDPDRDGALAGVRWADTYQVEPSYTPYGEVPAPTTRGIGTLRYANGVQPPLDRLYFPFATAVDVVNGKSVLYVVDTSNNRVVRYDLSGTEVSSCAASIAAPRTPCPLPFPFPIGDGIAGREANRLNSPQGIAVDAGHNILIADRNNNRVQVFRPDGRPYFSVVFPGADNGASAMSGVGVQPGVTVGPPAALAAGFTSEQYSNDASYPPASSGGVVATTDEYGGRVSVLAPDFTLVHTYGAGANSELENFQGPTGIRTDASGNLYVADLNNYRVHVVANPLDPQHAQHYAFGQPTSSDDARPEVFQGPYDLNFNHLGQLMVGDTGNQRVAFFEVRLDPANEDPSERFSAKFLYALGATGSPLGALNGYPRGVVEDTSIDPAGRLFVINTTLFQLQWFQIPNLAVVDARIVSSGTEGTVTFGVVVPRGRPTVHDVVPVLTSNSGVTIDPPDVLTVPLMNSGDIQYFRFHFVDARGGSAGTLTFAASATGDGGVVTAPPKALTPTVPCNDCRSTHTVTTPSIDDSWFDADVEVRLDATAGFDAVTFNEVPLSAIAWQYVSGPALGSDGDPGVHYILPDGSTTRTPPVAGTSATASSISGGLVVKEQYEGISTIQYWAVDAHGGVETSANLSTGLLTVGHTLVVGIDHQPPVLVCPVPQTLVVAAAGDAALAPDLTRIASNGGNDMLSQSPPAGTLLPHGTSAITLTLQNGAGHRTSCSTLITIAGGRPLARPSNVTAVEDTSSTIAISAITDAATAVSFAVGGAEHGSLGTPSGATCVPAGDGSATCTATVLYTPAINYRGADSFIFTASETGRSSTMTVAIAVQPDNDRPVAQSVAVSGSEDSSAPIVLSGSDIETSPAQFTWTITASPLHGTLSGTAPNLTYTPVADYSGPDAFAYTVTDAGDGASAPLTSTAAAVSITVAPVNDAPTTAAPLVTLAAGGTVTGAVAAHDVDGDTLEFGVAAPPLHGTVTTYNATTGAFTYTASAGYSGADEFRYTVGDGRGGIATGVVSITVGGANRPPLCTAAVAAPGLLWPPNHQFVPVHVNGVTDADGDLVTIAVTKIWQNEPTLSTDDDRRGHDGDGSGSGDAPVDGRIVHGAAQVRAERLGSGDGRVYDIFFTATDANRGSCTGVVTVAVPRDEGGRFIADSAVRYDSTVADGPVVFGAPPNRLPVAATDTASTKKGTATDVSVLKNDTDADGDRLSVVSVTAGAHGSTSVRSNGTVTYTPASTYTGTDAFTYSISDGRGGTAAATVTVTIKK